VTVIDMAGTSRQMAPAVSEQRPRRE